MPLSVALVILTRAINEKMYSLCLLCLFADKLKELPAPEIAVKYYTEGDLYLFGMCTYLTSYASTSLFT